MLIKAILLFLLSLTIYPTSSSAKEVELQITRIDRNGIILENGDSLIWAGLDFNNLKSSKTPAAVFSRELNDYLKSFRGQKIVVEVEPNIRTLRNTEAAYIYYFTDSSGISMSDQGVAARAFLKIDSVRKDESGRLKAQIKPTVKVMLNLELVKKGLARVQERQNFRHKRAFLLAEREAQLDQIGIWE